MPIPQCLPLNSSHALISRPPPAPSEVRFPSCSTSRAILATTSSLDDACERHSHPSCIAQELGSPESSSSSLRLRGHASRLDRALEFSLSRCPFLETPSVYSQLLFKSFSSYNGKVYWPSYSRVRSRRSRLLCRSQLSGSTESTSSPDNTETSILEQQLFPGHTDPSSTWDGNPLSLSGEFSSTAMPYGYVEEESLDPMSNLGYVHVVPGTSRKREWWKSVLRSLKASLNAMSSDKAEYTLVSKNFTKVYLPTRRTRKSPISLPLLPQIRRSKNELCAWFSHMGGNYGTALFLSLSVGYWLQGFRSFPWLAVFYHLKDGLRVDPGTLQFIQCTTNLPMVAKPIYGIISDAVYIGGARRIPYLMIAGALQMLSWGLAALHPGARSCIGGMIGVLAMSNIGAAIAEVVNDALVAESGQKARGSAKGELQSVMFLALAFGGILGNFSGGFALARLSANTMFAVFSTLVAVHLGTCALVKEQSFAFKVPRHQAVVPEGENVKSFRQQAAVSEETNVKSFDLKVTRQTEIPQEEKVSIAEIVSKQAMKLTQLVSRREIFLPLVWFASSYAVIPAVGGSLFFFQTQHLNISPASLGLAKVIGQMGLFGASLLYNRFLKQKSPRKILMWTQIALSLCMLTDLLLVCRLNVRVGVPDHLFVLGPSALVEAIGQFKILPVMVLLTQLCPAGSEASLLAFSMSCHCLATIVSGYLGVGVSSALHISASSFAGLPVGLVLQSVFALAPLLWLSFIPGERSKPQMAVALS